MNITEMTVADILNVLKATGGETATFCGKGPDGEPLFTVAVATGESAKNLYAYMDSLADDGAKENGDG